MSKGTVESLAGFFISDLNIDCATAVRKAIEHLNEGCTFDYVVDGFREWYGINIDSEYLQSILYEADDLLLPKAREQNAIFSLLEKEVPRDEEKLLSRICNTNMGMDTRILIICTEKFLIMLTVIYVNLCITRWSAVCAKITTK